MNSHCVPDFEIDEDYSIPCSTRISKKSSAMAEEDIMELLWQNGQVVVQSQRSGRKPHDAAAASAAVIPNSEQSCSATAAGAAGEIRSTSAETAQQHLFMQEDEMASWLHSPLDETAFERDIYADLLYPTMSAPAPSREIKTSSPEIRPQPPPPQQQQQLVVPPRPPMPPSSPRFQNFMHFTRLPKAATTAAGIMESAPSTSSKAVVESNETPTVGPKSRLSIAPNVACASMSGNDVAGTSVTAKELTPTCELTVTSSPEASGASVSASAEPPPDGQIQPPTTAEDRKRKGREAADDNEDHSMDLEIESGVVKKQARGSTSTKRSRAAEVHNLSERKRRDRINEKMRALQELIPRCNKSDKASMLDEAIEYLKSLQLQVQMMSMGCSMVPMMYPGVQQYMPTMGMGMGMGMGMDMSMSRPMMPCPPLLPGSGIPNSAAAAHVGPRFPMPAFHMPPVPVPDPSRIQTSNTSDPMQSSFVSNNPNQPRHPNFVDPYQQYISFHRIQLLPPQNPAVPQPGPEKPGSSREVGNPENHQCGG